jgi:CubicO group peptidase (beta-lactamase class C family)
MSLLPPLPIPQFLVTLLATMVIALPLLALIVAVTPRLVAVLIVLFRRDPGGPFVAHSMAMISRTWAILLLVLSAAALVAVQPRYFRKSAAAVTPAATEGADGSLRTSLAPEVQALIDTLPCAGVVIGVVRPSGNEVFGFGRRSVGSIVPPDGETVFEIGDMTQMFTATLFARLVEENVVRMDQTVRSLLPDTVSVPMKDGHDIELQHLATWSSGLPRIDGNPGAPLLDLFPPFSRAALPRSPKWLYDLLSSIDIAYPPGTHLDASDLGMGLLGHALERATRTDYETLLQRELCAPLGLRNTRVKLTATMRSHLAEGLRMGWGTYRGWYVASPISRWPNGVVPGADGLCSTADDLLTLERAHLAGFPLAHALAETRIPRLHVADGPDVGLGWYLESTASGDAIVWQRGKAGASRAYMAFLANRGVGVVVLANVAVDVDLLGKKVLNRLLAASTS